MATREQAKADSTVVQNMQWFQKSLMKVEASTFIHREGPSWPPQSVELGCLKCELDNPFQNLLGCLLDSVLVAFGARSWG